MDSASAQVRVRNATMHGQMTERKLRRKVREMETMERGKLPMPASSLAELLDCPPEARTVLSNAVRSLDFKEGEIVFRQSGSCKGLYVIVSGRFLRKSECLDLEVTLGPASTGELVELAAVLGGRRHNYTLSAQTQGSTLFLPLEALDKALDDYPPMRMHLLQELAREVSRAYYACSANRVIGTRHKHPPAAVA